MTEWPPCLSVLFLHNSFIVFIHSLEQGVRGVCAMLSWLNQSYATCDARRRWRAIKSESNDYFALAVDLIKPQYLHISHLADLTHTHTPRLWRLVWWFQLPFFALLFLLPSLPCGAQMCCKLYCSISSKNFANLPPASLLSGRGCGLPTHIELTCNFKILWQT